MYFPSFLAMRHVVVIVFTCLCMLMQSSFAFTGQLHPYTSSRRISMSGSTCVSSCHLRPHSLVYTPHLARHEGAFPAGTPQDILKAISSFTTCIVDPSLSPRYFVGRNTISSPGFTFGATSSVLDPFMTSKSHDTDLPNHNFFVTSTLHCPICIELAEKASAAHYDPEAPFVQVCNGICLDLCTPHENLDIVDFDIPDFSSDMQVFFYIPFI